MEPDKETIQVLTDGEELTNMYHSRGWGIAQRILADKILDLQNIANISDDLAPEKAVVELMARKMAAGLLFEFLREIGARIEGHKAAMAAQQNAKDEGFVERV